MKKFIHRKTYSPKMLKYLKTKCSRFFSTSVQKVKTPTVISIKNNTTQKNKKKKIPSALREQVWLQHFGKNFEHKCSISWCSNIITVFNWECGHNVPESKNGPTTLENLVPLCSRCNKSMGDQFTIDEFNLLSSNTIITSEYSSNSKKSNN